MADLRLKGPIRASPAGARSHHESSIGETGELIDLDGRLDGGAHRELGANLVQVRAEHLAVRRRGPRDGVHPALESIVSPGTTEAPTPTSLVVLRPQRRCQLSTIPTISLSVSGRVLDEDVERHSACAVVDSESTRVRT